MSTVMNPDIVVLQIDGAAAVTADAARLVAPVSGRVISVAVAAGTAPVGADLIVDVNVAGTSIFTGAGDRVTVAAGASAGNAAATAAESATDFVAGDLITIDIDQVGSTVAGSDLTVALAIVGDETPA